MLIKMLLKDPRTRILAFVVRWQLGQESFESFTELNTQDSFFTHMVGTEIFLPCDSSLQ
jgi:hypothetical protein